MQFAPTLSFILCFNREIVGLSNNMEATLSLADPKLKGFIEHVPRPEFDSTGSVFHDLISCIIEQQIHYRSTKNIFKNLLKRAGIELLSLENFELFDQRALQFCKISTNKAETIGRIIQYFQNHEVNWEQLTDEEVRAKLASIRGVGAWTIDMILLYTLGRKNIFPVDDFHLKQVMTKVYDLNQMSKLKQQMLAVAALWGDEKSLAVLYLLEAKKRKLV